MLKKGFSSRVRQQRNASLPPRRSAFLRLANAAAGSSKNITPKLLSTTSKFPAWNVCSWASTTSNLTLATSAAAASRRASATWTRDKSAPRACPLGVARAARMVVSPQPHPISRKFAPSRVCAAASNRLVNRPLIRSCRSRCSMKYRPLAPFQSSACFAFTATKATLYRPPPSRNRCPVRRSRRSCCTTDASDDRPAPAARPCRPRRWPLEGIAHHQLAPAMQRDRVVAVGRAAEAHGALLQVAADRRPVLFERLKGQDAGTWCRGPTH